MVISVSSIGKGVNIGRIIERWQMQPNSELSAKMVSKLRQYAMTQFLRNEADTVVMRNGERIITNGLDRKIISKNGTRYERFLQNNRIGNLPEQPWYVSFISGTNKRNAYNVELFDGKVKEICPIGEFVPITEKELIFDKSLNTYVTRDNIPFKNYQNRVQQLFNEKCEVAMKKTKITLDEYLRLINDTKSEIAYKNGAFEDCLDELKHGL